MKDSCEFHLPNGRIFSPVRRKPVTCDSCQLFSAVERTFFSLSTVQYRSIEYSTTYCIIVKSTYDNLFLCALSWDCSRLQYILVCHLRLTSPLPAFAEPPSHLPDFQDKTFQTSYRPHHPRTCHPCPGPGPGRTYQIFQTSHRHRRHLSGLSRATFVVAILSRFDFTDLPSSSPLPEPPLPLPLPLPDFNFPDLPPSSSLSPFPELNKSHPFQSHPCLCPC